MNKYILKSNDGATMYCICGKKIQAVQEMEALIEQNNQYYTPEDKGYLTPFDFTLEEVDANETNVLITDFEIARKMLNGCPNTAFKVSQKNPNGMFMLNHLTAFVQDANPHHIEALQALNKLFTIAEAWNKHDRFVPDFDNDNQRKWFPWFSYDAEIDGFKCVSTAECVSFGARICFKSESRARQFGIQFQDLWNEVLTISK